MSESLDVSTEPSISPDAIAVNGASNGFGEAEPSKEQEAAQVLQADLNTNSANNISDEPCVETAEAMNDIVAMEIDCEKITYSEESEEAVTKKSDDLPSSENHEQLIITKYD